MIRTFQKISVGLAIGTVSAAAIAQATAERPQAPVGLAPQPAQPQFENIFTVGEDGMPVPPATWLDIAALAVNPTIPADMREQVEAGVREWLASVQQLILQNPDLAVEAAKGLFENITIEARADLAHASEVMKALGSVTNLSSFLVTEGVLSNEQGETNRRIVQQYVRARSDALSKQVMEMSPEEQQSQMQLLMARTTMTSLTDDALRMFRSVAVRGAPVAGDAIRDAGIDASSYSAELRAVREAGTDDARYEAMIALMEAMEGMEIFRFAEALGEKLPEVELPGLARVGELHEAESEEG